MTAEVVEAMVKEFEEHQKKPERACRSALSEIGFLLRGLVSEMANAVEPVEKEILGLRPNRISENNCKTKFY